MSYNDLLGIIAKIETKECALVFAFLAHTVRAKRDDIFFELCVRDQNFTISGQITVVGFISN